MRGMKYSNEGRREQQLSEKAWHRCRDRLDAIWGSARRQSSDRGPMLRAPATCASSELDAGRAVCGRKAAMSSGKSTAQAGKDWAAGPPRATCSSSSAVRS